MLGQQPLPGVFVGRLERPEIGVERHFRVDDDVLAAGKLHDDVGADAAVLRRNRLLLAEVAVLHHAGELDHTLQLQLAPPAADARPFERIDETRGLQLQVLPQQIERRNSLDKGRAGLDAPALGFLDVAVDVLERFGHRREQVLDGLFSRIDVGAGFDACFAKPGFCEDKKRLIVGFQRLGAERLERLAQPRFGIVIGPETLGMDGALLFNFRSQTGVGRAGGEPAGQDPDNHGKQQQEENQSFSHQSQSRGRRLNASISAQQQTESTIRATGAQRREEPPRRRAHGQAATGQPPHGERER